MTVTDIYSQLTRDEGVRLWRYPDSRGFDSIGVGHNLDANPLPFDVSNGITMQQALQILHDDGARIWAKLYRDLPWLSSIDIVRQGVYQNMSFNMGAGGVENFHHDIIDTRAGRYQQSAIDMQQSAWYNQVGDRAKRLCKQMATGVWQ